MANLFETKQREYQNGVLLHSEFDKAYCGVLHIYDFESLEVNLPSNLRKGIRASLDSVGKRWCGAFENPAYIFKSKEPFNRGSESTYIGHCFSRLDIIPTSDGGRFFSLKKAYHSSQHHYADNCEDREKAVIHPASELEIVSQDLGTMLELMGFPQSDVKKLQREIFGKLGFAVSRITDTYPHVDAGELFKNYVEKSDKGISNITELIVHLKDQGLSQEEIG